MPLQIPTFLQKCKKEEAVETISPHDNTKTQHRENWLWWYAKKPVNIKKL